MPSLPSDAAAEEFTARADLTQYDLSGFKPMRFEIAPKEAAMQDDCVTFGGGIGGPRGS